jgi:cobalt-zinc-cadmium efflux system outer membrane protein
VSLTILFEARHTEVEVQRKLLTLQRERDRTRAQLAYKPLVGALQ